MAERPCKCDNFVSVLFVPGRDCRLCYLARFHPKYRELWELGPAPPFVQADGTIITVGDVKLNGQWHQDTVIPRKIPLDCIELGPVEDGQTCECVMKWRKCSVHGRARVGVECIQCPDYLRNAIPTEITPQLHHTEVWDFLDGPILPKECGQWDNVRDAVASYRIPTVTRPTLEGRGIIIAGGGKYWPSVYVTVKMIRSSGCQLPIQVWHLGREEFDQFYLDALDITCHDGRALPYRIMNGWELKTHAILHSGFAEILYLDADCYPLDNPDTLFDTEQYRRTGVILWPDLPNTDGWTNFGVWRKDRMHSPFDPETGVMVFDVVRHWDRLNTANWYNQHSDICYSNIDDLFAGKARWGYGDKGPMRIAFNGTEFGYFSIYPANLQVGLGQYGPDGKLMFMHRIFTKFTIEEGTWRHSQGHTVRYDTLPGEEKAWGFFMELKRALVCENAGKVLTKTDCYATDDVECNAGKGIVSLDIECQKCDSYSVAGPKNLSVVAVMTSVAGADESGTLKSFGSSDWADNVLIVRNTPNEPVGWDGSVINSYRALQVAYDTGAEYILHVENDVIVNKHLRYNILNWGPVKRRQLHYGALYTPDLIFQPYKYECGDYAIFNDRNGCYPKTAPWGAQAILFSREFCKFVLDGYWKFGNTCDSEKGHHPNDERFLALATEFDACRFYHTPNLVEHVQRESIFHTPNHRSVDFSGDYKKVPVARKLIQPDGIPGWLTHAEAELLYSVARNRAVLEMGRYKGKSTVVLAQSSSHVISVDIRPAMEAELWLARFGLDAVHFDGRFEDIIPQLEWKYDLIYVDGEHTATDVRRDIELALTVLKPNGLLAFHDYPDPGWPELRPVVDEYATRFGWKRVAQRDYLGVFQT